MFCAFIDFSQAFDSIWRVGLWRKLLVNGVDGKFFRLVSNMYKNIKSCVKNNGETSAFFASQCGVRQGENLSPVLFAMYLNDLESYLLSGGVETLDLNYQRKKLLFIYVYCYSFMPMTLPFFRITRKISKNAWTNLMIIVQCGN